MYLYEIYFINLWHPPLNRDDNASDNLTVVLPDVEWTLFQTKLWEDWKVALHEKNEEAKRAKDRELEWERQRREMRNKSLRGEISEDEYFSFLDSKSCW